MLFHRGGLSGGNKGEGRKGVLKPSKADEKGLTLADKNKIGKCLILSLTAGTECDILGFFRGKYLKFWKCDDFF